jgi:GT2 family glycosyltransferase
LTETSPARLSVVIVTYRSRDEIAVSLLVLQGELHAGDELIVVDNASGDGTLDLVGEVAPEARVLALRENVGFAAAANAGAATATGDLLLFLNPDVVPSPGFGREIRRPLNEDRDWAAWMGLVTMDQGHTINTSGNVVHFTGVSWAGEVGAPVPPGLEPREVGFVSGACLAIPRARWEQLGGFPPEYFMYSEDLDLSLRLRLAGGRVGLEPRARVDHAYEFGKGPNKWRLLERNRWATVIRTYPTALLLAIAPALAITEAALWVIALAGGWGAQKALATLDTARWLPRLLRERRAIQAHRRASAAVFAAGLSAELSSPYLGRANRSRVLAVALRGYWRAVQALLGSR